MWTSVSPWVENELAEHLSSVRSGGVNGGGGINGGGGGEKALSVAAVVAEAEEEFQRRGQVTGMLATPRHPPWCIRDPHDVSSDELAVLSYASFQGTLRSWVNRPSDMPYNGTIWRFDRLFLKNWRPPVRYPAKLRSPTVCT